MFLRSRVVGITASSPLLQRAYPFTWHVWHKGMGCRVCGFDSSAWIVCIYRWMVRLVMNTTFLENPKLSLNLGVVILCQNSLGGGCRSGAPLISDLLPRWLYALLQFRLIWCCFGLGCAMPSYLVVYAPPTRGPVTLHRLQTLLLRERENLLASASLGLSDHVFTFSAWRRAGNSGKRVRKSVFAPSQVVVWDSINSIANIHALLGTNISHYQGTFEGDYLVPWKIGISCIKQYSNIIYYSGVKNNTYVNIHIYMFIYNVRYISCILHINNTNIYSQPIAIHGANSRTSLHICHLIAWR